MRFLKGIIISTVMIGILLGFSFESLAFPKLQIYIPGATYDNDPAGQSWVINQSDFELWVVGSHVTLEDVRFAAAVPTGQDGTIEVTWLDNGDGLETGYPDYGSYGSGFPTLTFTETGGDDYTTYLTKIPPVSTNEDVAEIYGFGEYIDKYNYDYPLYESGVSNPKIPPASLFPTDFYEYYIGDFSPTDLVSNYDAGYIPGSDPNQPGMIKKFHIKVNGYTWTHFVAYGYYFGCNCKNTPCTCEENKKNYVHTPNSHDAAMVVPEPATLFLLGTGLIGLGAFGRKKFKKFKILDI